LILNDAHLSRCQSGDNVNITRGKDFRDLLTTTISMLYYVTAKPSTFSNPRKLWSDTAKKKGKPEVIRAWLEKQDALMLHRAVRKLFARNRNVMDVWVCDLLDV